MAPQHLCRLPQAPPLFTATAELILNDAKCLIELSYKVQDGITANIPIKSTTFNSLRDMFSKAEELINNFFIKLNLPAGLTHNCFKKIKKHLSLLSIKFRKNLNKEDGGIWFILQELEGMPEDVLLGLKKGDSKYKGKLWLTFNNKNKCNQNIPLFYKAVILCDKAACLLGYPNHAVFQIEDKIAKILKTVDNFLADLHACLADGSKKEITQLLKLKKSNLTFSIIYIFKELFGLVFVELTGKERTQVASMGKGSDIIWYEDIQVFSVWDDKGEDSGFVGYLYLDLFPYPRRYGHAANFNLQPGYINAEGKCCYPATALVCNFIKLMLKKPSLLKHNKVVTLFYELGYGIHNLVSKTTYSRFHRTRVAQDFVKALSQMLENWCWTPTQLKVLSKHYSTLFLEYLAVWKEQAGEQAELLVEILDKVITNIIHIKHVNNTLFNLCQLHFRIFNIIIYKLESYEAI
ncbi:peptidase family M3-domain-containing protein [Aspergillus unguis]